MIAGARILVDQPVRTPLPYGLWTAVQTPADSDQHWQLGIRYDVDNCGEASVTTDSCAATGTGTLAPTNTWITRGATPITVYTNPICGPVGNYDGYDQKVIAALTSGEQRAIEREFWTGAAGTLPHLAANATVSGSGFDTAVIEQSAATSVTGTPVDIVEGIALLEQNLAVCYGNEGVLHVPPMAAAHLFAKGLAKVDGPRLRSPMGHLIVIGSGYPGTAPDGTAPTGGVWNLYATGALVGRRTAISVTSSNAAGLDRTRNDMIIVAERTYVISWDCCHFTVPVRLGGEVSGVVGTAG